MKRTPLAVAALAIGLLASSAVAQLPETTVDFVPGRVALVITDPQNDFLSPNGVAWGVVGGSVEANGTVDNLDRLFEAASRASSRPITITPRTKAGSSRAHSSG